MGWDDFDFEVGWSTRLGIVPSRGKSVRQVERVGVEPGGPGHLFGFRVGHRDTAVNESELTGVGTYLRWASRRFTRSSTST